MRIRVDEFRRKYPNLARELFDEEKAEGSSIDLVYMPQLDDPWRGYTPGPVDYIRRAKTLEEALEVIDYLEKHGEITREEAEEYRRKLREEGLEAFGPRKGDNYYYRKAVEYWRKKALERASGGQRQQRS